MNPVEMYLRLYILTPQTLEAAKRGLLNAAGAFLLAAGAELVKGETNWYVILGVAISAAAGTFGVRTIAEGAYDSHRQLNGNIIEADVRQPTIPLVTIPLPTTPPAA